MDPLSQFRKQPNPAIATPAIAGEAEPYVAFATKDRAARLRVRCTNEPSHAPVYNCLLDVVCDDTTWTNFSLVFTFGVVLVRGENLAPVVLAIELGAADFIQEFDESRWQRPTDRNATVITAIQVMMQGDKADPEGLAGNNRHRATNPQRQSGRGE